MAFILEIKVVPSSGMQQWKIDASGQLKCYLKSPPEKGLANMELIKAIAKIVKVSQDHIYIMSGLTSRKKVIKINASLTYDQFLGLLGINRQQKLF
jgi:uncharacterized protein